MLDVTLLASSVEFFSQQDAPLSKLFCASLSRAFRSTDVGTCCAASTGYSSYTLPLRIRPAFFFWGPPHCLKKNGTPFSRHWRRIALTHDCRKGRAPKPLSPPTITQWIPLRLIGPRSSSSGSIDRKRTAAGVFRR